MRTGERVGLDRGRRRGNVRERGSTGALRSADGLSGRLAGVALKRQEYGAWSGIVAAGDRACCFDSPAEVKCHTRGMRQFVLTRRRFESPFADQKRRQARNMGIVRDLARGLASDISATSDGGFSS